MDLAVNCEETIAKVVGHRRPMDPLRLQPVDKISARAWRKAGLTPPIRKGVYKFHSHEEADQWLMDRLTRKTAN